MKQLTIISQVLVALILIPLSALAQQQVPFGSEVSDKVFHYHRHTPYIATSGNLADGAMAELADHGFKENLGAIFGLDAGESEPVIGLGFFWTNSFILFYLYYITLKEEHIIYCR